MTKKKLDSAALHALAHDTCAELASNEIEFAPKIIAACLQTLDDFDAESTDVIKVLGLCLIRMTRAQDQAAGAGTIVAIKLLALLMPGRDMHDVAECALDMLKATANGQEEPHHVRIVVMRREQ